jgi:hypothetical protein
MPSSSSSSSVSADVDIDSGSDSEGEEEKHSQSSKSKKRKRKNKKKQQQQQHNNTSDIIPVPSSALSVLAVNPKSKPAPLTNTIRAKLLVLLTEKLFALHNTNKRLKQNDNTMAFKTIARMVTHNVLDSPDYKDCDAAKLADGFAVYLHKHNNSRLNPEAWNKITATDVLDCCLTIVKRPLIELRQTRNTQNESHHPP